MPNIDWHHILLHAYVLYSTVPCMEFHTKILQANSCQVHSKTIFNNLDLHSQMA